MISLDAILAMAVLIHNGELEALRELYKHLCPFINYFYPSVKMIRKEQVGSRMKKIFDKPQTPAARIIDSLSRDHPVRKAIEERLRTSNVVEKNGCSIELLRDFLTFIRQNID